MLFSRCQTCCHINIDLFITKSHCSPDAEKQFYFFCMIAGFLCQFTKCCLICRLIFSIQSACRNLQSLTFQGIAVLTHHQKLSILPHRNDRSRTLMPDKIPFCDVPVRNLNGVPVIIDDRSVIDQLSIQPFKFLCHVDFSSA